MNTQNEDFRSFPPLSLPSTSSVNESRTVPSFDTAANSEILANIFSENIQNDDSMDSDDSDLILVEDNNGNYFFNTFSNFLHYFVFELLISIHFFSRCFDA